MVLGVTPFSTTTHRQAPFPGVITELAACAPSDAAYGETVAYAIVLNTPVEGEDLSRLKRMNLKLEDERGNALVDCTMNPSGAGTELLAALIYRKDSPMHPPPVPPKPRCPPGGDGGDGMLPEEDEEDIRREEESVAGAATTSKKQSATAAPAEPWFAKMVGRTVDRTGRDASDGQHFVFALDPAIEVLKHAGVKFYASDLVSDLELDARERLLQREKETLPEVITAPTLRRASEPDLFASSDFNRNAEDLKDRPSFEFAKRSEYHPAEQMNTEFGYREIVVESEEEEERREREHQAAHDALSRDRQRQSPNPFKLIAGDQLAIANEHAQGRIRVGLGWSSSCMVKEIALDLDVTVIAYAGQKFFDQCDFGKHRLRGGGVTHLGDNRTGSTGATDDESILIELSKLDPSVTQVRLW